MKKKRRLKKPIRRALALTRKGFLVALASTPIAYVTSYAVVPVHAEYTQTEIIKAVATLQQKDILNTNELKDVILNTKSDSTIDLESKEANKVVLTHPAVVVKPTIENSVAVIINDEAVQEEESDNENNLVDVSTQLNAEKSTTADTTNTKSEIDLNNNSNKSTADQDKTTNEIDFTTNSDDAAQDVAGETKKETTAETGVTDLDVVAAGDNYTVKNDYGEITLTTDSVEVTEYEDFDASDYFVDSVMTVSEFPVISIDDNVDVYQTGTYEVDYTALDTTGNTVEATLEVNVVKSELDTEEQMKARKEKAKEDVDAFTELTNGKAIDMDGYYGDQCWDLWAKYISYHDLDFDYSTQPDGYADYVFKKYAWSGASKYFEKIEADNVECGDWLFWDKGSTYSSSHVALLVKNNGDGTGLCLTQSKGQGTRLLDLKLDILGGFRLYR